MVSDKKIVDKLSIKNILLEYLSEDESIEELTEQGYKKLIRDIQKDKRKNVDEKIHILGLLQKRFNLTQLKEGDKVKFNIPVMKQDQRTYNGNKKRKKFIEDNIDKIFTVKYDKRLKNDPNIVMLNEDEIGFWFWEGELTLVR